jgi:hypothetical protein
MFLLGKATKFGMLAPGLGLLVLLFPAITLADGPEILFKTRADLLPRRM